MQSAFIIHGSTGAPFILNALSQWDVKIKAAFFVGGFAEKHSAEGEPNMDDFAAREFNWDKIKKNCQHFCVIHSDNDPYVPLEKARRMAENLGVEVTLVKGGGHFQGQFGFKTFDFLLSKINEVL